ncbi:MAG: hypothetical protein O3C40_28565 [Planctomycetota bacterium]|nr:hypothetical protein [Planctomycetota bacterium]
MDRETLLQQLTSVAPSQFVEEFLFDRIPHIFSGNRRQFIDWKRTLGEKLDVDPACITLVGSAATGISPNPNKNFKVFGDDSDVDVAVVSSLHFNIAWRYLRMNGSRRYRVDARTRNSWDAHASGYVYWGTIATDRLLGVLPFGLDWLQAASVVGQLTPTNGRTVNMRIYTDFDSLRGYHTQGIKSLRESIITRV